MRNSGRKRSSSWPRTRIRSARRHRCARRWRKRSRVANLYPDGGGFYLRQALAKKLSVAAGKHRFGQRLERDHRVYRSRLSPSRARRWSLRRTLLLPTGSIAALFGAKTVNVAGPRLSLDLEAILEAITPQTRVIFIANPNNPTGTLVRQKAIDDFMAPRAARHRGRL